MTTGPATSPDAEVLAELFRVRGYLVQEPPTKASRASGLIVYWVSENSLGGRHGKWILGVIGPDGSWTPVRSSIPQSAADVLAKWDVMRKAGAS